MLFSQETTSANIECLEIESPNLTNPVTFYGKLVVIKTSPWTFRCDYPYNIVCFKLAVPTGVINNAPNDVCQLNETNVYLKFYDAVTQISEPWEFFTSVNFSGQQSNGECEIECLP
jgi:hypothetical protein